MNFLPLDKNVYKFPVFSSNVTTICHNDRRSEFKWRDHHKACNNKLVSFKIFVNGIPWFLRHLYPHLPIDQRLDHRLIWLALLYYYCLLYRKHSSNKWRNPFSESVFAAVGETVSTKGKFVTNTNHCSFKTFLRFWLAQIQRLIRHNRQVLTKFRKLLQYPENDVSSRGL